MTHDCVKKKEREREGEREGDNNSHCLVNLQACRWLSLTFVTGQLIFVCFLSLHLQESNLTDKRTWARDLSQMTRSKKQKTNELHVKWIRRWKSIYKYFLITGYTCIFFSYYSLLSCWDKYFKVAGRLNHSKKRRLAVNGGKLQR